LRGATRHAVAGREHARRAAKTDHRPLASTSDLLSGLPDVEDGMAVRLLRKLDVDPVALRD
jgi:hypothetical protein